MNELTPDEFHEAKEIAVAVVEYANALVADQPQNINLIVMALLTETFGLSVEVGRINEGEWVAIMQNYVRGKILEGMANQSDVPTETAQ